MGCQPKGRPAPLLDRHPPETGDFGLPRAPMTLAGTQPWKGKVFADGDIFARKELSDVSPDAASHPAVVRCQLAADEVGQTVSGQNGPIGLGGPLDLTEALFKTAMA